MEKDELEEISGGAAVVGQAFIFFIIVPLLVLFASFVIYISWDFAWLYFVIPIIIVIIFISRHVFSFADIYFYRNDILIKKITGKTIKSIADYKTIDEGFSAFTYYVEFNDGEKVYFKLKTKEALSRMFKPGSDIADVLKEKFEAKKSLNQISN